MHLLVIIWVKIPSGVMFDYLGVSDWLAGRGVNIHGSCKQSGVTIIKSQFKKTAVKFVSITRFSVKPGQGSVFGTWLI